MQIDAILCNHAEAVNNLLYIAGGGIEVSYVQPGVPAPYAVSIGIGIMVTVPWQQTNQQHQVEIELIDSDGQPIQVPLSPEIITPFKVSLTFNVGRPANAPVGDDQHVALAANLPGLPLPAFGKYEFIIKIDGTEMRRIGYRIAPVPGAQITIGPGPVGQLPA